MKKPKLLVTGAAGFIGREVSRLLSKRGYRPRLMEPDTKASSSFHGLDAEFVQGDLTDPRSLKNAVRGMDGIIHLGAKATFESYKNLKPINLDGSLSLMEAAIEAGVKTFVYSSSLLVYANVAEAVDVDTPAKPLLDYGRIKLETEKKLNEAAASGSITFSALRLPHVYGSQSLGFRMLKEGRMILPGSGKCTYTHLHVTDAARSLISCAEQGYTQISPIGDNQPASWTEFISLIRSYYPEAKVLVLPQWLAMAGTTMLLPFRKYRAHPGMETPGAVRSYNCNIAVKPGLVWKDLGLTPKYPTIYDGIPAVVEDLENLNVKAS